MNARLDTLRTQGIDAALVWLRWGSTGNDRIGDRRAAVRVASRVMWESVADQARLEGIDVAPGWPR